MKKKSLLSKLFSRNRSQSEQEASQKNFSGSSSPGIGREYIAEQLEARILYSAAPVEADLPEPPAQEAPQESSSVDPGEFGSIDGFAALGEIPAADSDIADQLVTLTSYNNLSEEEIKTLTSAAIDRWKETGLSQEQLEVLEAIEMSVVDIDGLALGYAEDSHIFLDDDAAGYGWFVDSTPLDDFEFFADEDGILTALDEAAANRVDLLTVMIHEMGHVLGLEDIEKHHQSDITFSGSTIGDIMSGELEAGQRLIPFSGQTEGAVPLSLEGIHYMTVNTAWTAEGPVSSADGQVENLGDTDEDDNVAGAIHTVLAHPDDADILYIGATNGGIWKTENATSASPTWTSLTSDQGAMSTGALTFDSADATNETILAGIGRYSSYGRVGSDRIGILKTTDGGDNWTHIDGGGTLQGKNISGIVANGNTIVVSVNIADSFTFGNIGIFRSTDGGASFTQISTGNGAAIGLPGGASYDLVADPNDSSTLYTSTVFSDLVGGTNGVYKSTDSGANWTKVSNATMDALITNNTSNLEIAVGQHNNVYATIINNGNPNNGGIFRSGDGGANWVAMEVPTTNEGGTDVGLNPKGQKGPGDGSAPEEIAGGQGTIHFSIVADPNDPFGVYVGGDRQPRTNGDTGGFPNSIGANDFTGRLFRGDASQAIGSQWEHLTHSDSLGAAGGGTASSSAPHADSREMVFDANGDIIEVDDGGIYRRTSPIDHTGDWFSLNGNLQVTEAHDVAYDSLSNIIITGNQDTGTTYQTADGSWYSQHTGDGGDVEVDNVTLAGSNQSVRYTSFQNLGSFRRSVWDASGELVSQTFPNLTDNDGFFAPQFKTPVELNAVDKTRILIGGGDLRDSNENLIKEAGIYESTDTGATMTRVTDFGVSAFVGEALVYGGFIGATGNADLIYAGNDSGSVTVRTTAGGAFTTTAVGDSIRDIVVDPTDYTSAFALDTDQIFMSTDTGANWLDITNNLTTTFGVDDFYSMQYIPTGYNFDALVVGTERGVYHSLSNENFGTWYSFGSDMPNAPVWELDYDIDDDVLIAGTLGRGAFSMASVAQTALAPDGPPATEQTGVSISGNDLVITDALGGDTNDDLTISTTATTLTIVDNSGEGIDLGSVTGTGDGTSMVTIDLTEFSGGIVYNSLDGDDKLTVDFSTGSFTRAITFNGGDQATSGDSLVLAGSNTFDDAIYAFTNNTDGTIQLTGQGLITYTGLEPVTSTINATNVTLDFSGANETITVSAAGAGQTTVDSDVGESVTFNNPTGTLSINTGAGDDVVNLNGLGSGFSGSLVIDTQTGTIGEVNISGAFDAGNISVTDITGDVNFADNSSFNVDIAGTTAGTGHDQLTATGDVVIGSNVSLLLQNFYADPATEVATNDSFTILETTGTITGTFAGGNTITNFLGSGKDATIAYTATSVTITVGAATTQNLSDDGTATSLREMIKAANTDGTDSVITLGTGEYVLTRTGTDDSTVGGDLDIANNGTLTIVGAGKTETTISAGQIDRVFDILNGATVTFKNLTISGGNLDYSHGAGFYARSGSNVTLENVCITDNLVQTPNTANIDRHGGGFWANNATVTGTNVTISDNTAERVGSGRNAYGGGFYASGGAQVTFDSTSDLTGNKARSGGGFWVSSETTAVTLNGTVVDGNSANAGSGGGFFANDGTVNVNIANILNNSSTSDGAGFRNNDGTVNVTGGIITLNQASAGGGFSNQEEGDVILDGVTITKNTASNGAGFYQEDSNGSIVGANVTLIDNTASNRGGGFYNATTRSTVDLTNSVIDNNRATNEHGGGFANQGTVILHNTAIQNNSNGVNTGDYGGGFYNNLGDVTITGTSPIQGNTTTGYGGGFWNRAGEVTITGEIGSRALIQYNESGVHGAGFFSSDKGTTTLTNVNFVNNTLPANRVGAGFYATSSSVVNLTNVDINNHTSNEGGAFYISDAFTTVIGDNVSLKNNTATTRGGAFRVAHTTARVELTNSVIESNTATNEHGGGFYSSGEVVLDNVLIKDNHTFDADGGSQDLGSDGGLVAEVSINGYGGGFYNSGGDVTVKDSKVEDNSAFGHGGGFASSGGVVSVIDSIIQNNVINSDPDTYASSHWRIDRSGGGFASLGDGVVNVTGTTITGNRTRLDSDGRLQSFGGGFYNADGSTVNVGPGTSITKNQAEEGGGFYNTSTGSIVNLIGTAAAGVTIQNNNARVRGGGFRSLSNTLVNLEHVLIDGNTATAERGGGFYADGAEITGSNVTISNNSTIATTGSRQGGGGWISSYSVVDLTDSLVQKNTSANNGGGLYVENATLNLTNSEISENFSQSSGGGVMVTGSSIFTAVDSSVSDNIAYSHGGGFYITDDSRATLTRTHVDGNLAGYESNGTTRRESGTSGIGGAATGSDLRGGGFWASGRGHITMIDSTLDDNEAARYGGGGNMENESSLTLIGSTVANNVSNHYGGGFRIASSAQLDATNSTISGNYAGFGRAKYGGTATADYDGRIGGALWSQSSGNQTTLNHVTITDNYATSGGSGAGAGIYRSSGLIQAENSIIFGNFADAEQLATGGEDASDIRGAVTLVGANILGSHSTSGGSISGDTHLRIAEDPNLQPLGYYGGFGRTHAITPSSIASGAAVDSTIAVDQTGVGRAGAGTVTNPVGLSSTGADLLTNENVTLGVRTPTVSGSSLQFLTGVDSSADSLLTVDILPPGEVIPAYPMSFTVQYDFTKITGDHDPQFRLSDGVNTVVLSMADNDGGRLTLSGGTPSNLFTGGGPTATGVPSVATMEFVLDATGTTVNGSIDSTSGSSTTGTVLSPFGGLTLEIRSGDSNEDYQIDNLQISLPTGITGQEGGADLGAFETEPVDTTLTLDELTVPENAVSGQAFDVQAAATTTGAGPLTYAWTVDGVAAGSGLASDSLIVTNTATDPVRTVEVGLTVTDTATGQSTTETREVVVIDRLATPTATAGSAVVSVSTDGGEGSLRDAILQANASEAGNFVITFASGIDPTLSIAASGDENGAANGDLDITKTNGVVSIVGNSGGTIIDGGDLDRVFDLRPGSSTYFTNLTITGGETTESDHGAGLRILGANAIFKDVDITGNDSIRGGDGNLGGAIYMTSSGVRSSRVFMDGGSVAGNNAESNGGGIYMAGTNVGESILYLDGTRIDGNTASSNGGNLDSRRGGGVYMTDDGNRLFFNNVTVSDNRTLGRNASDGGGLAFGGADHTIEFNGGSFVRNQAGDNPGGTGTSDSDGGAFWSGGTRSTFNFDGSTIGGELAGGADASGIGTARDDGNVAEDEGGGFYLEGRHNIYNLVDTKIIGNQANDDGGGFMIINNTETVNISQTGADLGVIRNNFSSTSNGGGFRNDGIVNIMGTAANPVEIRYNEGRGSVGGGFYTSSNGTTTLTDVVVRDNVARNNGGGYYNSGGGHVIISSSTTSTSDVPGSFVSKIIDNQVTNGTSADGGGFYQTTANSTSDLTDVLISGNTATDLGGGFYLSSNYSKVTLTRVDITDNQSEDSGGGFFVGSNGALVEMDHVLIDNNRSKTEHGGGFYNAGLVSGNNVTITNNKVGFDLDDNTISTGGLYGGGFYNTSGQVRLVDAVIDKNVAQQYGGGFMNRGRGLVEISSSAGFTSSISDNGFATRTDSDGGGFWNAEVSTVRLSGVEVNRNVAPDEGGGFYQSSDGSLTELTNVLIDSNTAGDNGGGFANASSWSTVTMNHVTISNNQSLTEHGGGFRNSGVVTGSDVVVTGNRAGADDLDAVTDNDNNRVGGGIYNTGSFSRLELDRVRITDNTSHGRGGGIYNTDGLVIFNDFEISGNITDQSTNESQGRGGGIWNSDRGELYLSQGEISGNSSFGGGGGIFSQNTNSVVDLTNVTLSDNLAGWDLSADAFENGRYGGAIWAISAATTRLDHVTITRNRATRDGTDAGGGIRIDSGGHQVTVKNSIVYDNFRDADNGTGGVANDVENNIGTAVVLEGLNIIGPRYGTMANEGAGRISTDPNLGALQDNGGFSKTHAPDAGSLAIDSAVGSTVTVDQRGVSRPAGKISAAAPTNLNSTGADLHTDPNFTYLDRTATVTGTSINFPAGSVSNEDLFSYQILPAGEVGPYYPVNVTIDFAYTKVTTDQDYVFTLSDGTTNRTWTMVDNNSTINYGGNIITAGEPANGVPATIQFAFTLRDNGTDMTATRGTGQTGTGSTSTVLNPFEGLTFSARLGNAGERTQIDNIAVSYSGFTEQVDGPDIGAFEAGTAPEVTDFTLDRSEVNENDEVTLTGYGVGTSGTDDYDVEISWGDGSPVEIVTVVGGADSFTATHNYADDGVYTVSIIATGQTATALTSDVTVNNVAPTVTAITDQTVAEGTALNLTDIATFEDPGFDTETFTYSVDWGDGSLADTGNATIDTNGSAGTKTLGSLDGSHIYADNGIYTVTITLQDDDGGVSSETFQVRVNNAAPTADDYSDRTEYLDKVTGVTPEISFPFPLIDPGTLDTHPTVLIDWGDGSAVETGVVTETPFGHAGSTDGMQFTLSNTHSFTEEGIYTVTIQAIDDDGARLDKQFTVYVVPAATDDPEAPATLTTGEGTPLAIDIVNDMLLNELAADPANTGDDDIALIGVTLFPSNGVLSLVGGQLVYTPNYGFSGTDSFEYAIDNGEGTVAATTASVTVVKTGTTADLTATASTAQIVTERQNVKLGSDLTVDAAFAAGGPGTDTLLNHANDPGNGTIARNTIVSSHILHLNDNVSSIGSITFDTEILGIIWGDANLDATDGLFGSATATYPGGTLNRGIIDDAGSDFVSVSADGRTLTFSFDGQLDQIRILTAPDPNETATVTINVTDVPHTPKSGFTATTDEDNSVTVDVTDPNWNQQGVLTPDPSTLNVWDQDRLGRSVRIDGDLAIVGGAQSGVIEDVYVYRRDAGGTWNLEQRIINPQGNEQSDNFGEGIAIDAQAGQLFIGADQEDAGPGNNGGVVYIYNFDATTGQWELDQTIGTNQNTAAGIPGLDGDDSFGFAIDVTNDGAGNRTLVVGARGEDTVAGNSGAAYIYDFNAGADAWEYTQQIKASDAQASDNFGFSVAIEGGVVVIGSPTEDTGGSNDGSTYVYQLDAARAAGDQWIERGVLRAPDRASSSGGQFGYSVDISGDTVVVGDPFNDEGTGDNGGRVHVFRHVENGAGVTDDTWEFEASIDQGDKGTNDNLGISVAIEGDTIIAGAYRNSRSGEGDRGSAYLFTRAGTTWTQSQELAPGDENVLNDNETFGRGVAISSDGAGGFRYMVGAELADVTNLPNGNSGFWVGKAEIFSGDAGSATSDELLSVPASDLFDLDADNEIGRNVTLSADGNTAVVGAPLLGDGSSATDQNRYGAALVYQRVVGDPNDINDDTWQLSQTLFASDLAGEDRFGHDVSISHDGSTIVVGAYDEHGGGLADSGSIYVFELNTGTGNYDQQIILNHSPASAGDEFGYSVAVNEDGSIIAAGARLDHNALGDDEGSVFVWTRDVSGSWAGGGTMSKIEAGDPATDDQFGRGIALSGNRLVVGAQLDDDKGANSGSVYVYEYDGFVWQQTQKLVADDGAENDRFGANVDIHGGVIVVGAYLDHHTDGSGGGNDADRGSAYVFRYDGTSFVAEQKLTASNAGQDDEFGRSVAVFGDRIIVGAWQEDTGGSNAGAAYTFEYNGVGAWTETEMLVNSERAADNESNEFLNVGDNFGISVDIGAATALVGANNFNFYDDNGTPDDPTDDIIYRNHGAAVPFQLAPFDGDSDPANSDFTVTGADATTSGGGIVTFDGVTGEITFDPNDDFEHLLPGETEVVTFNYTISDGSESSVVTGKITVTGVNDAPVAVDDPNAGTTTENSSTTIDASTLFGNDTDPDDMVAPVVEEQNLGGINTSLTEGVVTMALGAGPIGEVGTLAAVTHEVQTVTFTGTFTNPVVIATITSYNEADPVVVRINNVDATAGTFDIQLVEPSLIDRTADSTNNPTENDGLHAAESASFIVMEAGTHVLQDGTRIEVGTVVTDNTTRDNGGFVTQSFSTNFQGTPAVLTQIQTINSLHTGNNNPTAGTASLYANTRQNNSTADGFDVAMENQDNLRPHPTAETIGYIAIEQGSGVWDSNGGLGFQAGRSGNDVNGPFGTVPFSAGTFTTAPTLITTMSTTATNSLTDEAHVRVQSVSATDFSAKSEEDTSANEETSHPNEMVDFIAIEGSGLLYAIDPNGSVTYDPNGQFDYLAAGENATDTFQYTVRDKFGLESTATATVTITGVNDGPADLDTTAAAPTSSVEGTTLSVTDLLTFTDLDLTDFEIGATENWSISVNWGDGTTSVLTKSGVANGTSHSGDSLTLNRDTAGAKNLGDSNVEPTANQFSVDGSHTYRDDDGDDTFTISITVNDGNGGTASDTLDVTIANVDPTAVADAYTGAFEDAVYTVARANGVLFNDTDPANTGTEHPNNTENPADFTEDHNDQLTVTQIQSSAGLSALSDYGAAIVMSADGGFTYDARNSAFLQTLVEGETIVDTFTYTVADGDGGTSTNTVSITVTGQGGIEIDMNNVFPAADAGGYMNPNFAPGTDFTPGSAAANPGGDGVADSVSMKINGSGELEITVNGVLLRTVPAAAINNANGPHDITFTGSADDETLDVNSLGTDLFGDVTIDTAGGAVGQVNFNVDSSLDGSLDVTAGAIDLGANLTTVGSQDYKGAVNLTADIALESEGTGTDGNITFENTIDGSQGLSVKTDGTVDFKKDVGGTTPLTAVDVFSGQDLTIDVLLATAGTATGNIDLVTAKDFELTTNGELRATSDGTSAGSAGGNITVKIDHICDLTLGIIPNPAKTGARLDLDGTVNSGVNTVNLVGGNGFDAFYVKPGDDSVIHVDGGDPVPGSFDGDLLVVTNPDSMRHDDPVTDGSGYYDTPTDTNKKNVTFESIEKDDIPPALENLNITEITNILTNPTTTLSGKISDLGVIDGHTLTVDWGDGSPPDVIVLDRNNLPPNITVDYVNDTFAVTHTYANDGKYDVKVGVTDSLGLQNLNDQNVPGLITLPLNAYFNKPFFSFIGPNRLAGVSNLFQDMRTEHLFVSDSAGNGISDFSAIEDPVVGVFGSLDGELRVIFLDALSDEADLFDALTKALANDNLPDVLSNSDLFSDLLGKTYNDSHRMEELIADLINIDF